MKRNVARPRKRVKNERTYFKTIAFKCEPSYDEREAIIRRALYREQDLYQNKPFRFIIVEKTMKLAKIKFFVK